MTLVYPKLEGEALQAAMDLKNTLLARAMAELRLPNSELIVRSIVPADLGFANVNWGGINLATANTNVAWVSANTITDNRFTGIYGWTNNEAVNEITQIEINRKGSVARYWGVDSFRLWKHNTGFFTDPIVFDQNTLVTINVQARATSTVAAFAPLGITVEKRGLLVNP